MKRIPILFAVGLFLTTLSTAYLNSSLYPSVALFFPLAREIATWSGAGAYVIIAFLAMRYPHLLCFRRISVVFIVVLFASAVPLVFLVEGQQVVLSVLLLSLRSIGSSWATVLMAIASSSIQSKRVLTTTLIIGIGGAGLVSSTLIDMSPYWLFNTAPTILPAITMLLFLKRNEKKRHLINRRRVAEEQGLLQPFPSKMLVQIAGFVFLFGTTQGFSLAIRVMENTPFPAESITLVFLILLLVPKNTKDLEDNLFILSSILMIAGYLVIAAGIEMISANSFLSTSKDVFSIVAWILIAMVGKKSILQLIPFLAIVRITSSVGLSVGAAIGHSTIYLAQGQAEVYAICSACILFVFLVYLIINIRRPVFALALNQLAALSDEELAKLDINVEKKYQKIGEKNGLTPREIEILDLLAKGRNSIYIQEKLVISKNTTKTHIKHIYQKLEVHSRQELLDAIDKLDEATL